MPFGMSQAVNEDRSSSVDYLIRSCRSLKGGTSIGSSGSCNVSDHVYIWLDVFGKYASLVRLLSSKSTCLRTSPCSPEYRSSQCRS